MATPQPPPDLEIPESKNTVTVSIIDTTASITIPASMFMEPNIKGNEMLTACCFSFKIEHNNPNKKSKYDTLLFDLGVRKDLENSPKPLVDQFAAMGAEIPIMKNVVDILEENGDDPKKVGGIIWSHHHVDHTGDPSTFPLTTDLIVGPGFKKAFVPAWPTIPEAEVNESAWANRTLREIDFQAEGGGLKIGQYDALDLYGDGSFYLLDTPGHAIGHICGLARTQAEPPEFILMGGDIAHHGGEFRPTKFLPLPKEVVPSPLASAFTRGAPVCLGSIFEAVHPKHSTTEPFTHLTDKGVHHDHKTGQESLEKMFGFDANDSVFINIAHDTTLLDVVDLYSKTANGWSKKGWKEESRWRFLKDFDTTDAATKALGEI